MASPVKEIPVIISMLFGQHKRLMELERRIKATDHHGLNAAAGKD
jgi:hypothetical protein